MRRNNPKSLRDFIQKDQNVDASVSETENCRPSCIRIPKLSMCMYLQHQILDRHLFEVWNSVFANLIEVENSVWSHVCMRKLSMLT